MSEPSSTSADAEEPLSSKLSTSFSHDIVREVLRSHLANPKTKITDDAVDLMTELAKVMVVECSVRAAKQCSSQNKTTVTLDHIEAVLPQLMLDFP